MKVVFNRQSVLSATLPLMAAATGRATMNAVDGILIEAKMPSTCTFTAFDLEKGMRTSIETNVVEEGSYIINAQKFVQVMRVMDGEEVTLNVDENMTATFSCGKSTHRMGALNGSDFPDLPSLTSNHGFTLKENVLREMLQKTMYAMGVNDQRPVLNGCYFVVSEDKLLLVSCDSFKMAKCGINAEMKNNNTDGSDLRYKFILPVKTVNELFKLLSAEGEREVAIHMGRRHIIFYIGDMIFFSRLVDGEYIDFDRIIINQHRIHIELNKEELLAALERASLITEERAAAGGRTHVKLEIEGNLMKISASSSAGSSYDEVEIEHDGADLTIAFRNSFLIDSLRACNSEKVKISLSSPLTSVNIEPIDSEDEGEDIFMLLPVRTKD